MIRPESSGPESAPTLLDLPSEAPHESTPIMPIVSSGDMPLVQRSAAWDDIGDHEGPFILPVDEDQVFAIDVQSPNITTARDVNRIETNRRFGLTGKVDRTPEQDENAQRASEEGHEAEEQRNIASGMSPEEARARRIVKAMRRGKNTEDLTL